MYKKMTKKMPPKKRKKVDKILIADDSNKIRIFLSNVLKKQDYKVVMVKTGEQVLDKLKTEPISIALLYLAIQGINGMKLLNEVKRISPRTEIIVITTSASIQKAIKIIAKMSLNYIIDPFNATEVRLKIDRVIDRRRVFIKNKGLIEKLRDYRKKLGQRVLVQDKKLQRSNAQLRHTYKELKVTYDNLNRDRRKLSTLNKKLTEDHIRTNKDLEMAYGIQRGLLPKEDPKLSGIKTWARSQPAKVVGGDFYFFRRFREEDKKLGIVIGDVAGKGIPAALVMAMVSSSIEEFSRGRKVFPQKVISRVNKSILEHLPKDYDMFITLFYSIIDLQENKFIYSKAGQNPPLLFNGAKHIPLEAKGPPIGEFKNCSFKDNQIRIRPGSKIVFYTDGITETMNKSGKMFGAGKLKELIAANNALGPKELGEKIFEKVKKFRGKEPQADDLTLVIVEIENKKES